jgi:hypothetical protein
MRFFACFVLLTAGLVLAHGVNFSQLQGVKLCIDTRSVLVVMQLEDASQNIPQSHAVQMRLYTSLRSTRLNYQVPFVEKKLCTSKDGFVFSAFYLAFADMGDGQESVYAVRALTQTGEAPARNDTRALAADTTLPNMTFDSQLTSLVSQEEVTTAFDGPIQATNEDTFRDLATSWWENNPDGLPQRTMPPQVIGGSVSAFIFLIGAVFMYRQLRKEKRLETDKLTSNPKR